MLKDVLLFRDDPNLCIGLFVNDEISTAINCICTEWLSDSPIFSMCYSSHTFIIIIFFIYFMLYSVYDFNNNNLVLTFVFNPRDLYYQG